MRSPTTGIFPGLYNLIKNDSCFSLNMWKKICFNHFFEIETGTVLQSGRIKMPVYLSLGQEHISAAISCTIQDIMIFAQHRGHSYYLSFGGAPSALIDELLHRETGCAKGMGGSASIHDPKIPMYGHSGLMGDQVPIAVGAALAMQRPALAITGDASVEEDYVFGAMGYAATKQVPVLFICEDNNLSILTPVAVRRSWRMVDVARALGMPAIDITDDPWLIHYWVSQYRQAMPAFINIHTCRSRWHNGAGIDGPPEWNRFELIQNVMREYGFGDQAEQIKVEIAQRVKELWVEHLQRP